MKTYVYEILAYIGEFRDSLFKSVVRGEYSVMPIKMIILLLFFLAVLFDVILYYFYGTDLITIIRRFIQNSPNAIY